VELGKGIGEMEGGVEGATGLSMLLGAVVIEIEGIGVTFVVGALVTQGGFKLVPTQKNVDGICAFTG